MATYRVRVDEEAYQMILTASQQNGISISAAASMLIKNTAPATATQPAPVQSVAQPVQPVSTTQPVSTNQPTQPATPTQPVEPKKPMDIIMESEFFAMPATPNNLPGLPVEEIRSYQYINFVKALLNEADTLDPDSPQPVALQLALKHPVPEGQTKQDRENAYWKLAENRFLQQKAPCMRYPNPTSTNPSIEEIDERFIDDLMTNIAYDYMWFFTINDMKRMSKETKTDEQIMPVRFEIARPIAERIYRKYKDKDPDYDLSVYQSDLWPELATYELCFCRPLHKSAVVRLVSKWLQKEAGEPIKVHSYSITRFGIDLPHYSGYETDFFVKEFNDMVEKKFLPSKQYAVAQAFMRQGGAIPNYPMMASPVDFAVKRLSDEFPDDWITGGSPRANKKTRAIKAARLAEQEKWEKEAAKRAKPTNTASFNPLGNPLRNPLQNPLYRNM